MKTRMAWVSVVLLFGLLATNANAIVVQRTSAFDLGPYNLSFSYNGSKYNLAYEYNTIDRPLQEYQYDPIVGWSNGGDYGVWILNASSSHRDNIGYIDIGFDTETPSVWKNSDEYIKFWEQLFKNGDSCKIYKGHYTWAATKRGTLGYYARSWYSKDGDLSMGMDASYPDLLHRERGGSRIPRPSGRG